MSAAAAGLRLGDLVPDLTEVPSELTLRPGEEQTVRLPSLAGGGYVWEAVVEDETVAEASTHFEQAEEAAGGGRSFSRSERLILRAREAGTTRVRRAQRRTWETEPVAAHSLTVNVVPPDEGPTERGGTT